MIVVVRPAHVLSLLCTVLLLAACSQLVYTPTAVVPNQRPLPYSAKLTLAHLGSYIVDAGAVHATDADLSAHVVSDTDHVASAREEWEHAILRYLEDRKTFAQVSTRAPADVDVVLHMNVYVDPGALFHYQHVYVARTDAAVADPKTHRVLLSYTGNGKAFGEVSRDGKEDDREPVDRAVQLALNDLFEKMERDGRMGAL